MTDESRRVALIVPTLNMEDRWADWIKGFEIQTVRPDKVIIIDSASTDRTAELARRCGFDVHPILRSAFNHGGTRDWGVSLADDAAVLIFMTDDATLAAPDSLKNLLRPLEDRTVAAVFGRQLPRKSAAGSERHARLFNYPAAARIVTPENKHSFGRKAVFFSNSFAAYRREAFESAGGFPRDTILCEDTYLAGKLLLSGWSLAYEPTATVFHSHGYSVKQEFKRYFDLGVFQSREVWLRKEFGGHNREGLRFAVSELKFLARNHPTETLTAPFRLLAKYMGYQLGLRERYLSTSFKQKLSMHCAFWTRR